MWMNSSSECDIIGHAQFKMELFYNMAGLIHLGAMLLCTLQQANAY